MLKFNKFVSILGELVSRQAKSFDSEFTLLCSDVNLHTVPFPDGSSVGCFRFKIKSPKVDRVGNGDEIEVFQVESGLDPFSALARYKELLVKNGWFIPGKPFFRRSNGFCLTRDQLNCFLREKFAPLLSPDDIISSHSFRAGVSSHMQSWGFSSDDIKGKGFFQAVLKQDSRVLIILGL